MTTKALTPATIDLFTSLWNDAPNWAGQTLVDVTKEQRGNLTALKRADILVTFNSDGNQFVSFLDAADDLAASLDLPYVRIVDEYGFVDFVTRTPKVGCDHEVKHAKGLCRSCYNAARRAH